MTDNNVDVVSTNNVKNKSAILVYKSPGDGFQDLYFQGYSLVPVTQSTKKAMTKWKKFQERQPTRDELVALLGEKSSCNWALLTGKQPAPFCESPTGVGLVVLDADDQEAVTFVRNHCASTPLEVETPSGGRHFYYRYPTGLSIRNRQKTKSGGKLYNLDVRADGGYVIAPGGIKSNGGRYNPNQKLTPELLSSLPVYDPAFIPLDDKTHETSRESVSISKYETHDDAVDKIGMPLEERLQQARDWVHRQPGSQQGRAADAYCFRLATRLVWGFVLPADDAFELLLEWGETSDNVDDMGNPYPWSSSEIGHKINSAVAATYDGEIGDKLDTLSQAANDLYDNPEDFIKHFKVDDNDEVVETTTEGETMTDAKIETSNEIEMLGVRKMLNFADTQQEDWLIENWLEFGSTGMLTGNPFSGKSTIVAELIAGMHTHGTFGGYDVPSAPVILIDFENRHRIVATRLRRATGEDDCASLVDKFARLDVPEMFMPLTPAKLESIINACMQHFDRDEFDKFKPLVIIDTFRSAFECDEMDTKQIKELLYPLQRVAQRTNSAILILHHRPKGGAHYSGQTSIAGALDYLWMWDSDQETREGKLTLVGTRGDVQQPLNFRLDENNRNVFTGQGTPIENNSAFESRRLMVEIVNENPGMMKTGLPEMVQDRWRASGVNGNPLGINKLQTLLNHELEEGSSIIGRKDGKATKLYPIGYSTSA